MKTKKVYVVYRRVFSGTRDRLPLKTFSSRKDAVFWCKVNQISSLPDGEWQDDYEITLKACDPITIHGPA